MSNLEIKRDEKKGKIWSHVRSKWLVETPEETVRQVYLMVLVNDCGFALDQIAEEMDLTARGSASARADFVTWRTTQDKADDNAPFISVECKSDNVTIKLWDYGQGENYARIASSDIIVCDLTGQRPNVFVEACYALKHHESNRLILLFEPTSADDKVPFDLNTFKYVAVTQAAEIPNKLGPELTSILRAAGAQIVEAE